MPEFAHHLAQLFHTHLYLALAAGGLMEGETVVVLAGFAAHQGHASWWGVTLFAAAVNALVDQAWFLLGPWRGPALAKRFPGLGRRIDDLAPRIHAHRHGLVFGLRFSYGLRVAGPVALAMAGMRLREFALLNIPAALVWATLFSGIGYAFGLAALQLLDRVRPYEPIILGVGLALGLAAWWMARRR